MWDLLCQKAPSAKRRIKTPRFLRWSLRSLQSQKAPSAKRRIKTGARGVERGEVNGVSESTERQKAH